MLSYNEKDVEDGPRHPLPLYHIGTGGGTDGFERHRMIGEHNSLRARVARALRLRRTRAAIILAYLVLFLYFIWSRIPYVREPLIQSDAHANADINASAAATTASKTDGTYTPFPRKIWQTSKHGPGSLKREDARAVSSWTKLNQSWRHEILTGSNANTLVRTAFGSHSQILPAFVSLTDPIFRADIIRYLVMLSDGGLYSDLDTLALKPVDDWIAPEYRAATKVVVGIEYDRGDGCLWQDWTRDLQFATWAMLAQPDHPLFALTIHKALASLEALARQKGVPLSALKPTYYEVLDTTGPAVFTDAIFEYLAERTVSNFTWRNVTKLESPMLVSDILILPIHSFGSGQAHSGAGPSHNPDALVKHQFRGSWKTGPSRFIVEAQDNDESRVVTEYCETE